MTPKYFRVVQVEYHRTCSEPQIHEIKLPPIEDGTPLEEEEEEKLLFRKL